MAEALTASVPSRAASEQMAPGAGAVCHPATMVRGAATMARGAALGAALRRLPRRAATMARGAALGVALRRLPRRAATARVDARSYRCRMSSTCRW